MSEFEAQPAKGHKRSRTSRLRAAMMAAVSPRDVYDIVKLQVFLALKGDPLAVREVLDRTVGKPVDAATMIEMEQREVPVESRNGILESEMQQMLASVPSVALPAPQASEAETEPDCDSGSGAA